MQTVKDEIIKMLRDNGGFMSVRLFGGTMSQKYAFGEWTGVLRELERENKVRREERLGYEVGVYVLCG